MHELLISCDHKPENMSSDLLYWLKSHKTIQKWLCRHFQPAEFYGLCATCSYSIW